MKRKCLSTIIVIALASAILLGSPASLLAESFVWSAQVSGTAVLLSAMQARDASHAWAVGQAGNIRYTSNGGATWAEQASGTGEDLQGISSTGPTHAWAVGDHGEVRVTSNGGVAWGHQDSGVADDLSDICAVDEDHAWLVGWNGTIRHTQAGGTPWVGQNSHTTKNLWGVSATDSQHAWVVGNSGTIRHTSNAGTTWSVQSSGTTAHLRDVFAQDSNRAWAVGDSGTLLHTTNGGGTWVRQTSNTVNNLRAISATDDNHAWIVGQSGTILFSSDGGAHWYAQAWPVFTHYYGLATPDPLHAFACGDGGNIIAGNGQAPSITSVSPSVGSSGTQVTVKGSNFGSVQTTSTVTFKGVAAHVISWADTQVRVTVPAAATGGPVVVSTPFGKSNEADFDVRFPNWYLAEGTTAWGFSTYITLENPNVSDLTANVTYMPTGAATKTETVNLPASAQTTLTNDHLVSLLGQTDFSTRVTCKEGATIAVDRTMSWTGTGAASEEAHSSIGVTAPSRTWYLPEGSSNWGFETWTLVQNPNSQVANVTLTYMTDTGESIPVNHQVPAGSRESFSMASDVGSRDASIMVRSDRPVIPERAMYRNSRREGHDSIGTTTPAPDFYLAEGTTAWGFTTYVLIQNPNPTSTDVTVTYMTTSGAKPQAPFTMAANSRKTIRVNDVPGMGNIDFSTAAHGTKNIIAERAMYWGADTPAGEACHDSIGLNAAHTTFYLPDGQTSGGRETWTLVQNPNKVDVKVEVTYLPPYHQIIPGPAPKPPGSRTFTATIPANSRRTFNMADEVKVDPIFPYVDYYKYATMVECKTSGKKIMVERAMYWNSRGAGTDTIGGYSD